MPHSTRKNRGPTTRRHYQTVGPDGWIFVSQRRHNATNYPLTGTEYTADNDVAAAPDGLTLTALQQQFETQSARWRGSESWADLKAVLQKRIVEDALRAENCVSIALGSLSGMTRREGGPWIDRTRSSLGQLAVLKSILDLFSTLSHPIHQIYTQDPVFNALDTQILSTLSIRVVPHPQAFCLLNHQTFLFCPGAERHHALRALEYDPCLYFGNELQPETFGPIVESFRARGLDDKHIIEGYVVDKEEHRLGVFDTAVGEGLCVYSRTAATAVETNLI